MNDSRRSFLKKAALLAGGAGAWNVLPLSIERALAISPHNGTTFNDAEHVVILMQENRSFDHCFGTLRGVRGFNDPVAISLPDKNPVWFQPDNGGNHFVPFRLDMKDTKATWMGGVPHSWEDQVDARNNGKYNGWIEAKRPGNKEYKHIPLTMGYYTREDIPFYYALADAFTVCDQHFCAALTGTTTNRSYLWTGKTHGGPGEKPRVRNGELNDEHPADWHTFPETLEDNGISWKVYQNEISLPTSAEDESLLGNFTDNNLEWFSQYGVRYATGFREYLQKREEDLPAEIDKLKDRIGDAGENKEQLQKNLLELKEELRQVRRYLEDWSLEKFQGLPARAQRLHKRAFTTNIGDRDYHKVEELSYQDGTDERVTKVPKGDILYQFRKDVDEGNLPTVSWLVAPQKFSDHPSAPWYGAWYVSEVLDILTRDPEVWKKTIFILNYDENDGYFDHVPPFVAPNPQDAASGKVSAGVDATGEYVTIGQEVKAGFEEKRSRTSPVGLGFRVPLIVASPWSRGGWVNSEVFDITSTILFLEKFLSGKKNKEIKETNISPWRRTISGNLTSVFRPYHGEEIALPEWLKRNEHIKEVYNTRFKKVSDNFKAFKADDVAAITREGDWSMLPQQERGTKPSNALKYDLHVDGKLDRNREEFVIRFQAAKNIFGDDALGAPFNVYAPGNFWNAERQAFEPVKTWAFAVKAGDAIAYRWPLKAFEGGACHLRVYGPNGFFREFAGRGLEHVQVSCQPVNERRRIGMLRVNIMNGGVEPLALRCTDDKYQMVSENFILKPGRTQTIVIDTSDTKGWYNLSLDARGGDNFKIQYAGRLETGADSISDPYMGGVA